MTSTPNAKRRILLVDDDELILATIGQVLRNAGFETAEASSGAQALQLELEFNPDLAILDVVMTGMSGIELAQRLHTGTTTQFMFISARGEADIVRQATEHGAVGYLVKPFDIAQVVPAVETALGRADEIKRLRGRESSLTSALAAGRETGMAVGMLMAHFHVDRDLAFEALRSYSRANRRKVHEVANELLDSEELRSAFRALLKPASD
ncbi:response regulator [Oxalobacteraceae bacterium]|nr:response regulator [Oxalobacteraceae bacterium]